MSYISKGTFSCVYVSHRRKRSEALGRVKLLSNLYLFLRLDAGRAKHHGISSYIIWVTCAYACRSMDLDLCRGFTFFHRTRLSDELKIRGISGELGFIRAYDRD